VTTTEVRLDLDVETYNYQRTPETFCPRVLVVLVMPAEEAEWVNQSPDELALRHCAYWLSLQGYTEASARSTIRVGIPLTSLFSADAVQMMMQRLQERKPP
jgi:hypothetical protein